MTSLMPTGREGATRLGVARIAFGVAALAAPTMFGRAWVGDEGSSASVALITRAFGVRDVALGLGAVLAARRGAPVRGWIEAGLLCDTCDVIATLTSGLPTVKKMPIAASAVTAVIGGVLSLQGLEAAPA